jgi:hypothetical protein
MASATVHDEHRAEPSLAFMLCRLSHGADGPTPIGVFRDVERPVYDEQMAEQLERARAAKGKGDLAALVASGESGAEQVVGVGGAAPGQHRALQHGGQQGRARTPVGRRADLLVVEQAHHRDRRRRGDA